MRRKPLFNSQKLEVYLDTSHAAEKNNTTEIEILRDLQRGTVNRTGIRYISADIIAYTL